MFASVNKQLNQDALDRYIRQHGKYYTDELYKNILTSIKICMLGSKVLIKAL